MYEKFVLTDCNREIEAQTYLINDFKDELLNLKFYGGYKEYLGNGEQVMKYMKRNPFSTYDPRSDILLNWSDMYTIAGGLPYCILQPQGINLEDIGGIYVGKFTSLEAWKILRYTVYSI